MEYESKIEKGEKKETRVFFPVLHQTTRKQIKIGGHILKMNFQMPIIPTLYVSYEFYSVLRGKNYVTL